MGTQIPRRSFWSNCRSTSEPMTLWQDVPLWAGHMREASPSICFCFSYLMAIFEAQGREGAKGLEGRKSIASTPGFPAPPDESSPTRHSREAPASLGSTSEAGSITQWVLSRSWSSRRCLGCAEGSSHRVVVCRATPELGDRRWREKNHLSAFGRLGLTCRPQSVPLGGALPSSGVLRLAGYRVVPGQRHPGEAVGSGSPWHSSSPHVPRDIGGCS